jgi:acyl-CoA hydrolase/GNAT superfamily N-acetyltransferase
LGKNNKNSKWDDLRHKYPEKFVSMGAIFSHIRPGDRIFVGTGCGEPQFLVRSLVDYVKSHPDSFFDAEVLHVWTLGVAPCADEKFKDYFRHNSFFIGKSTRDAVNRGAADYTPLFLSAVPKLFQEERIPVDVAMIQTSPPDDHGYLNLGISVDIVKAATEKASTVIAQVNSNMPRIHGDGFINICDIDFIVPHNEPVLEYEDQVPGEIAQGIGKYVARIIEDGSTIQVGYGSIPNAILCNLTNKKHLGVHTELLTDGIADLMRKGVVDNTKKTVNRNKTIASFCMGKKETYEYLHDNPLVEFKTIDYTNDPLIISKNRSMTAINSALEMDLTGQATGESIGRTFYSGIGGMSDFMRGAILAPYGKTILALPSTANGGNVSRIVPFLSEGAGVTLTRGDIHYVVTEYGIAYLHGKNIRERAMDLIAIAHPKFRPWLIEEAKKSFLIYTDQAFIPGERGEYPESLEAYRATKAGLEILLRPVRINDEPLLKDFFYSLSEDSMYYRFFSARKDRPHEWLQDFVVIDYTKEFVILAVIEEVGREKVIGLGQYVVNLDPDTAEIAVVVGDDYQKRGVGAELVSYLTFLAQKQGIFGFTAEILAYNKPALNLVEKKVFDIAKQVESGTCEVKMMFKDEMGDENSDAK